MKHWLSNIFLALIPVVLYLILGAFFNASHPRMLLFFLPCISLLTCILLQKRTAKNVLLINTPIWLIFLGGEISISLSYIVFIPIFVWLAVLFNKKKNFIFPVIVILLSLLVSLYVFPNSRRAITNKEAQVSYPLPDINFLSKEGKTVDINSGLVILDFWTTSCGACFKKFPIYNDFSLKYANDPNIKFYAVNVPTLKDQPLQAQDRFDKLKYHFPSLYSSSQDEITNKLGFDLYPHLMVIKDGQVLYSGMMITDKKILFNRLDQLIKKHK